MFPRDPSMFPPLLLVFLVGARGLGKTLETIWPPFIRLLWIQCSEWGSPLQAGPPESHVPVPEGHASRLLENEDWNDSHSRPSHHGIQINDPQVPWTVCPPKPNLEKGRHPESGIHVSIKGPRCWERWRRGRLALQRFPPVFSISSRNDTEGGESGSLPSTDPLFTPSGTERPRQGSQNRASGNIELRNNHSPHVEECPHVRI